jgi:pimeloyl-ACP methyl ester carboxylesterase
MSSVHALAMRSTSQPVSVVGPEKPKPGRDGITYVRVLSNPDSLPGSFGWYRALDTTIAQDEQRKTRRLTMPVLAIGGEASFGEHVGEAVQAVADDVQSVVIPGVGHFVAEEAPEEMLEALTAFLSPYRDGEGAARAAGARAAGG